MRDREAAQKGPNRQGSREAFEAVLAKVPDVEPHPWDDWSVPEGGRLSHMAGMKVEIELPRNLLAALDIHESELGRLAKEWVLIELFLEGKISAGKAAEVLGLSKAQFLDLLDERNLPYLDADLKELEREAAAAQAASRPPQS